MARKTITTCDRCGKNIPPSCELTQTAIPVLNITAYTTFNFMPTDIDLCPVCQKQFFQWLENNENQENVDNGPDRYYSQLGSLSKV